MHNQSGFMHPRHGEWVPKRIIKTEIPNKSGEHSHQAKLEKNQNFKTKQTDICIERKIHQKAYQHPSKISTKDPIRILRKSVKKLHTHPANFYKKLWHSIWKPKNTQGGSHKSIEICANGFWYKNAKREKRLPKQQYATAKKPG